MYRDVAKKRSTMFSFAERLACVPRRGPPARLGVWRTSKIGLLAIVIAAIVWRPELAIAQADAPPRDYTDLGPHFVIAPGFGVSTEYRDLLLRNAASARLGLTATYRGFSLSGFAESSLTSPSAKASEIAATYSHKLPYIDAHFGFAACDLSGAVNGSCGGLRIAASTNSLPYTKVDITVDASPSGRGHTTSLGLAQQVWRSGPHQVDLRVSGTRWDWDATDASGWSVRAIGRYQIDQATSVHYHVGYISSRIEQSGTTSRPDGALAGLNFVWEFR